MKIGIFGGSFDPIHKGHVELVKSAMEILNLDKVVFVPAYKNPFKSNNHIVDGYHRINMIKEVLPANCEISDFEIKRNRVTYTIETVKSIKRNNDEIYLLIGSDNLKNLHKWKNINELSRIVHFIVFNRNNKIDKTNLKKYNAILLNNEVYEHASTLYKNGRLEYVDDKVQSYIAKNFLYLDVIGMNTLSYERFQHCKNVALYANNLAKLNNVDHKVAYYAGLTHDYTKYWSQEQVESIIKEFEPDLVCPIPVYHQYTVYLWLKYKYLSPYEDLNLAVRKHTTADFEMSTLDKILYVSDKLAIGRKFTGIQELRVLSQKDLNATFIKLLEISKSFVVEKHGVIDEHSEKILESWLK